MKNFHLEQPWTWRYGKEKMAQATIELLLCRSNVRARFAEVYQTHLLHICEENVPSDIWSEMLELRVDMRAHDHPRYGAAWASAQAMHHSKLNKHIRRLGEWMWTISDSSVAEDS